MKCFAAFLLLALAGCRGIVDTVYPVEENPVAIEAGSYRIDVRHASVIFHIDHMGLARFYGRMPVTAGILALDPERPETAMLSVTLDANGIDTADAELDATLRGFLKADRHPAITFESNGLARTGETAATVTGNLTIAGETRPVTLAVTFAGRRTDPLSGKERLGFNASGNLRPADFGLSASWTAFVGETLSIEIGAEFTREE